MIGYQKLYDCLSEGLTPNKNLSVDLWSDANMFIPKSTGSREYGEYRTSRTPHAREIMLCLSDSHPCRRVIAMVASQMFKTQICLNWLGTVIDQSPSNFILSMPTGKLQKRIGLRFDKVVKDVPVLRDKVAKPKSRDAMNNQDIKEFVGGSLFIVTSGSSANLSEVPAKYAACDEVDRGEEDHEGSRVKLIEARQTSFGEDAKSYYYSSPTMEGESEISNLFKSGTQREALAECIHCGHAQMLVFENLVKTDTDVVYPCVECGGIHKESDKMKMFKSGLWSEPIKQSENQSFVANALFLPYGWKSWVSLMQDYDEAKILLDNGDDSEMVVFYNTRLARCWERQKEATNYDVLMQRAEDYRLGTVPNGALVLTAAIDTQGDRLELCVIGWGKFLECWVVDYQVIMGDPVEFDTWKKAHEILTRKYQHVYGVDMQISNVFVDSGGHHIQEVYNFCRKNKALGFYPIKGSSKPNAPIIPNRPSYQDLNYKGEVVKKGVSLWQIGTDAAKDYLYARWKRDKGAGAVHFSGDLPEEYYKQVVSEYRATKYINGHKKTIWTKKQSDRNEALDLMVYNLACAHKLGLHRWTEAQWNEKEIKKQHEDVPKQEVNPITNSKISLANWGRGAKRS